MAERVCPVWVGYLLASPVRKLFQNPKKILGPFVKDGMRVLDIGCAMGFFSLPMAEMVGSNGRVVCVDLQEKMIRLFEKRANKAGLLNRIETRICKDNSLGLDGLNEMIDFALAFYIVHEVPDVSNFFSEIYKSLKHSGKLLVAEPKGHTTDESFESMIVVAKQIGFMVIDSPRLRQSRVVLLEK